MFGAVQAPEWGEVVGVQGSTPERPVDNHLGTSCGGIISIVSFQLVGSPEFYNCSAVWIKYLGEFNKVLHENLVAILERSYARSLSRMYLA